MSYQDFITQAVNFSIECQLQLPSDINPDGSIKRFSKDQSSGSNDKDEWYVGHELNGQLVITFGTWKNGSQHFTYRSWNDKQLTPEQLQEFKQQYEHHVEEVKRIEAEAHSAAAERAQSIWHESTPCETHPYLEKKGVKSWAGRIYQGVFVLPIYDAENDKLISLQFISDDGTKRFLKGGRTANGYYRLGNESKDPFIGEGFATCASVTESTGKGSIVAFSSSNCVRVGLHLKNRDKLNTGRLLQDLGEAGEKAASQWKERGLGDVCIPNWGKREPKSDWNDLATDLGKEEVARQLKAKRLPSFDMMDFLAMEKPPVKWIIEDLFTEGSFNIIYAGPGEGKSMMAMHLGMSVQFGGTPFEGHKSEKKRVLYVDAELTASQLDDRLKDGYGLWASCVGADADMEKATIVPWLMVEDEADIRLDLFTPMSQAYMNPLIEDHDFIILDNFDKLTRRGGDTEDARSDEAKWQGMWDWLRYWKNKGKTFLILAHSNKNGVLRGTGKFKDDADTAIQISRIRSDILPSKFAGRLSMVFRFDKARSVMEDKQKDLILSLATPEDIKANEHPMGLPMPAYPWEKLTHEQIEEAIEKKKNLVDATKLTK